MSFFELSESDLNDGTAVFSDGDTATLVISSVAKKEIKGILSIIIESIVTDGKNAGLKYPQFFRLTTSGGKKSLGIFLRAFLTPSELASMQDPNALINRRYTASFIKNGEYVNIRGIKAVNDVPESIASQPVNKVETPSQPTHSVADVTPITGGITKDLFK